METGSFRWPAFAALHQPVLPPRLRYAAMHRTRQLYWGTAAVAKPGAAVGLLAEQAGHIRPMRPDSGSTAVDVVEAMGVADRSARAAGARATAALLLVRRRVPAIPS
jgi:hypothetical protein